MSGTKSVLAAVAAVWACAAGLCSPASAQSFTLDVTGTPSYGALGNPQNAVVNVVLPANAVVTGIEWNVTLTTVGASWLSEMSVQFRNSSLSASQLFAPGAADLFPGTASYASAGVQPFASPIGLGPDGLLQLEFFETFDDFAGAIDGVWAGTIQRGEESTLTIHYIPTPSGAAALAFGAGALARRRRR